MQKSAHTQKTNAYSKSAIETLEKSVKYNQP